MSSATVRVVISVASGSLALCFNSLLACIILTTKCFYIGNYKFLLFLYTVSAATYSIGQITTAAVGKMSQNLIRKKISQATHLSDVHPTSRWLHAL